MSDDKPKTTRLDPRPVSETPGLWPLKKVSRQELAELYPVVDEKPEPISGAEFVDGMPGMSDRINKLMRSLMRHRERYIRAWIAHYGARPEQVSLVESWMDAGRYGDLPVQARTFSVRFVKDTDDVAELVKAAREVLDDKGSGWLASDTIHDLEAALKKFEG